MHYEDVCKSLVLLTYHQLEKLLEWLKLKAAGRQENKHQSNH